MPERSELPAARSTGGLDEADDEIRAFDVISRAIDSDRAIFVGSGAVHARMTKQPPRMRAGDVSNGVPKP